jgi:hypothetical protein
MTPAAASGDIPERWHTRARPVANLATTPAVMATRG